MAESEVSVRFTSKEEAQLWQAFVKLSSGFAKAKQGASDAAKATDGVDQSLKRFARSVKEAQSTPDSRLADEMAKIDASVKATLLTEEEASEARTAANERYRKELQDATGEVERFAAAQLKIDETPADRLRQKTELLNRAVKAGEMTGEQAAAARRRHQQEYQIELTRSQRSQQSLSAGAVAAGQIIAQSWSTALAAVGRFSSAMQEEHRKALEVQQQAGGSLGMLAQISDSEQQMQDLTALARDLVRTGAASDVGRGAQVVFDLANANALDQVGQLRQLAEPGVIRDLPQATTAANAVRSAMGNDVGSVTDIIAKSLKAAQFSSANAEQLAAGAARAGSEAAAKGMSVNELLAATGIIGDVRGSAEEGGTRLASLLRGMQDDQEVRGKSLLDSVRAIRARNLPPEELTKQLTAEGADAFRILATNLQKLDDVTRATAEQVTAVTVAEKRRIALSEQSVRADMVARQQAGQVAMMREAEGRVVQLTQAAVESGAMERRTGARSGIVSNVAAAAGAIDQAVPAWVAALGPAGAAVKAPAWLLSKFRGESGRELDAMAFSSMMGVATSVPGSAMPGAVANSDRTNSDVRQALQLAIEERERERQQFNEMFRRSAETMAKAAASMERAADKAGRADRINPARREAAAAHGGG